MRMLLICLAAFGGCPVAALAQTAVDAKNLTIESLMEGLMSYEAVLTQEQQNVALDALKGLDKQSLETAKGALSKTGRIPVHLLNVRQQSIRKGFAEHEDPIVRFLVQYELGKTGDKQAAAHLHALLRHQFSEHQAQMLRTMACLRGIVPERDSVQSIADLLASYGRKTEKLKVGDVIGNFQVIDVHNAPVTLDGLKGKPTVFHFWATWCGPCMAQMDECVDRIKNYPSDVNVVFVNLDLDRETCNAAIKKIDLDCIHVYGENQILSRMFGIKGLPHDAWIDANGNFVPNKAEEINRLLGRSSNAAVAEQKNAPERRNQTF